jgi:hypothetical protein
MFYVGQIIRWKCEGSIHPATGTWTEPHRQGQVINVERDNDNMPLTIAAWAGSEVVFLDYLGTNWLP